MKIFLTIIFVLITAIPFNTIHGQVENLSIETTNYGTLWTKTAGPYGGKVNCMAEGSGRIFIGSASGIYTSTDFGLSWIFTNYGFDNSKDYYDIKDINVNGVNVFTVTSDDIYFSSNNGNSWNKITPTVFPISFTSITSRISGSDIYVFAGTSNGVYRTSNYGSSWTQQTNGLWDQSVKRIFYYNNVIFVATPIGGVFRSTDNGDSWTSANVGLTDSSVITFYGFGQLIFASTRTGIYRSTNNGLTWGLLNNSPTYVADLYYDGNYLIAAHNDQINYSTDYGATWPITKYLKISTNYINTDIKGITKNGSDLIVVTDSRAGIYKSTNNGDNWFPSNYYLNANTINCFGIVSSTLFCGTNNGLFKTADNGIFWSSSIPDSNGPEIFAFLNAGSNLFLGTHRGVYKSTDNGITWNATSFTNWTNALLFSGSYIFAGTYQGIFRSSNYGLTWDSVNTGLKYLHVTTLLEKSPYILAGTENGGIYRSSNYGLYWDSAYTQPTNKDVLSLAKLNNILLAGCRSNNWGWKVIYRSVDDGLSWTPIQLADIVYNPPSVLGFAISGSTIFAATGKGVYVSKDGGFNWYQANDGLWTKLASAIIVKDTNLFLGTYDNGVWRCSLPQILDVESLEIYPESYLLYQNYPNPFNPSTTIKFEIPKTAFVTLKIYNILGQEVAELVNEEKQPGVYEVNWNASGFASGVYFYQLRAGSFVETKKMILLR